MSSDSPPAKWFCDSCILFTAVALLHREFPDIAGFALLAIIFTPILLLSIVALGMLLFATGWLLTKQASLVLKTVMNVGLRPTDTSQNLGQKPEPPILAEFLVGLCAKRRYRNGLLQNLEEKFESNLANGATIRRARRNYWAAALNSIGPQLLAAAKRVGIIGLIADYARRLLH
jgi:hypothetical protein